MRRTVKGEGERQRAGGRGSFVIVHLALACAVLAACSGASGGRSATDIVAASEASEYVGAAPEDADLVMWAWVPGIDEAVNLWNEENPDTQITLSQQAQGDDLVTKVLTAAQAGNPPDLIQVEYQALPTLVTNDVLADISDATTDLAEQYAEGPWSLVTLDTDAVYAVPQDIAPMMLYYRQDIFEELELEVPTTWDQFAQVAQQVRDEAPDRYLTTFSSEDPGWFVGLSQQAGASWWGIEGDAWSVTIDDEATRQVAQYWGDLVAADIVDDQPMYTPEWNTALNEGTLIAWPSAVWAPGVLAGIAAETEGLWSAAPLPQWGDEERTGYWGGSSTGIAEASDNKEAAVEFATWLNTDPDALQILIESGGIYPAQTQAQTDLLSEPPAFIANDEDYFDVARQVAETAAGFTFGPNVNTTYSVYRDAFGSAISGDGDFAQAVTQMQRDTVQDMRDSGFSLVE
jgi:multiple sugar transport system substrate-binding protein